MWECITSSMLLPYSSSGLWNPRPYITRFHPRSTTTLPVQLLSTATSFCFTSSPNYSNSPQNSRASESEFTGELGFEDKVIKDEEKPDFLKFGDGTKSNTKKFDSDNLLNINIYGGADDGGLNLEQADNRRRRSNTFLSRSGRRRQTMNRSSMLAKQVISIQSAFSLGFVTQLWVDTNSWVVSVIELRTNLLSGEAERFLLDDIDQVGDVVLIQDEGVTENEIKMVGLETLVGYNVVTPGRQNIGKVRGYTFNINSGAVESLELDSFGISIIPSSLVSTYALFVEDVLEVASDAVIVHEAAASRIQRLTKGFGDAQKASMSTDEFDDYNLENLVEPDYSGRRRRQSSSAGQKPNSRGGEIGDDWELPMDYL